VHRANNNSRDPSEFQRVGDQTGRLMAHGSYGYKDGGV
jgi:hypothetical protein